MHAFLPEGAIYDTTSRKQSDASSSLAPVVPVTAVVPALQITSKLCSRSVSSVMLRQHKRMNMLSSMHEQENEETNANNSNKKLRIEQEIRHPLHQSDFLKNVLGPTEVGSRDYMMEFTSLSGWEFHALLEHLQRRLEEPRDGALTTRHRPCKLTVPERLLACLSWLKGGDSFRRMECHFGTAKTSINDDLRHVMKSLVKGLDSELTSPDSVERRELSSVFDGVFSGCVGLMDVTEHRIQRPVQHGREHEHYSAKHSQHSIKTLAVIDRLGYFRFVQTGLPGRMSDRECFTNSDLYLERGQYFAQDEWAGADGGFRGDGPLMYSYDGRELTSLERVNFNLVFKEVRVQVENAFNRLKMKFSVLGNEKAAWNCSDELLCLTVHATVRLHNWLLRIRNSNYCASTNAKYLFRENY